EDTEGQEELGLRFFEGAAAGALLLGEAPNVPSFAENFDWPDAVLPMRFDEPDVASVLARHDAEPERMEAARRQGIVNSLLRHDFVYRWEQISRVAGLEPRSMVAARKKALADRALLEQKSVRPHVRSMSRRTAVRLESSTRPLL